MPTGEPPRLSAVVPISSCIRDLLRWAEVREFAANVVRLPTAEYIKHGIHIHSGTKFPPPEAPLPNGFRFPSAALDHYQRAAFSQAIDRYSGPDPSAWSGFDRLQALAWRQGEEITPALVRRWTSELAVHNGISLDAAQSAPVNDLLELATALMVPAHHAGGEESAPPLLTDDLDALVRPHPPVPPSARLEAAALFVADVLSTARLTSNDQRALPLSALAGLPSRQQAVPSVDPNGYRWAVRRMLDAGLLTVEMVVPPPSVRLSAVLRHKRDELPTRDAKGDYQPGIATHRPPVPYIRSTPELWERWHAGRMFAASDERSSPPPAGSKPPHPPRAESKDERRKRMLYESIRQLKRGGMTEAGIVAYLNTPAGKDLLAEVRWELDQRPKTRTKPCRARVPDDVVAAALRPLYSAPRDD